MTDDLLATRKRLRELLALYESIIDDPAGLRDAEYELHTEAINALPALLSRIDELEAAVRRAEFTNGVIEGYCRECGEHESYGHKTPCIYLTLPPEEPKP